MTIVNLKLLFIKRLFVMKKFLVLVIFVCIGLVASAQSSSELTTSTTTKVEWNGVNATKVKVALTVGEVVNKRGLTATGGNFTEKAFTAPILQDSKGKFYYWRKTKAGVWALVGLKK